MNKQKKKWMIGKDVTEFLSFAHLWYLGIIVVIYILMFIFFGTLDAPVSDFLNFSYSSASIYMIIMGAIGAYYFFPVYIQLGVTRKQTFFGNVIGALGGALTLVIFTVIISLIQHLIFRLFNWTITDYQGLIESFIILSEETSSTHFLLGTSFLSGFSRWVITLLSFWLSTLLNYAIGWMIGTGFYRGSLFGGVGTILLGILFLLASDIFWSGNVLPFLPEISLEGSPSMLWFLAVLVIVASIALIFWFVRQLTKKMPIKL
ncbi:hypothetical protein GCM10008932_18270 [Alkalibacterium iburiense]|uniref:ABC transporter permease n=1 Tax=Alkalibacterium iburiense TaxID=290589 RepID=A0ABN0XKX7_9LACT